MGEAETDAATLEVEIGGLGGDVTLADLFPPAWVGAHCDASSIGEFVADSDFHVSDQESFESIPDREWDDHVAANSEFEDWQSMLSAGVEQYALDDAGDGTVEEACDETGDETGDQSLEASA